MFGELERRAKANLKWRDVSSLSVVDRLEVREPEI